MLHSAGFNKTQLRKLLTIEDPKKETIYGVVGRMKVLLEFFKHHPEHHRLVPFLATYYYVTKTSAGKYLAKERYFHNVREYEILDVYFASLYFKPLLSYLLEGSYTHPWQQYFHYCERKDSTPFLQMLLGINAHINADLYTSLVDLHYSSQHDFFLVDDILQEVVPSVLHFLAYKEHDFVSLTGLLFKDLTEIEFHTIIERWRSEAWIRAHFAVKKKKNHHAMVLLETEHVGAELIDYFSNIHRVYKAHDILDGINKLSVRA